MSSAPLNSFNPFAVHPFTNSSGLPPQPARPSQYPLHIPASMTASSRASNASHSPSSTPSSSPVGTPTGAPVARRTSTSSQTGSGSARPIFETFVPDSPEPELGDILKHKKLAQAWGFKQQQPKRA